MPGAILRVLIPLIVMLLAACTSADPWRHFPQHAPLSAAGAGVSVLEREPATQELHVPAAAPMQAAPRRAVPADIARMPPAPPPAPAVSMPSLPPAPRVESTGPRSPTSCDPGGCHTSEGRTQGGTGNVQLGPGGRPCHLRDGWLQCF